MRMRETPAKLFGLMVVVVLFAVAMVGFMPIMAHDTGPPDVATHELSDLGSYTIDNSNIEVRAESIGVQDAELVRTLKAAQPESVWLAPGDARTCLATNAKPDPDSNAEYMGTYWRTTPQRTSSDC